MAANTRKCTGAQNGMFCECQACMDSLLNFNAPTMSSQLLNTAPETTGGLQSFMGNTQFPTASAGTGQAPVFLGSTQGHTTHTAITGNGQNHLGWSPINLVAAQGESLFDTAPMTANSIQTPAMAPGPVMPPPSTMPLEFQPLAAMESNNAAIAAALRLQQQRKTRMKRKSKYTDEPPHSIYGPPFITRDITTTMDPDEVRNNIDYNKNVMEAKKIHMRHKNNAAAKKSRERRQELIDRQAAQIKFLTEQNLQLQETIRRQTEREERLKEENGHLRKQVDDHQGQIEGRNRETAEPKRLGMEGANEQTSAVPVAADSSMDDAASYVEIQEADVDAFFAGLDAGNNTLIEQNGW